MLKTIIYFDLNGYKGLDLIRKLSVLKGQHSDFFERAYALASEEFKIGFLCLADFMRA